MKPAAPTIGRIIYVESNLWQGVRPAVIVDVANVETNPTVRANVLLDGTKDSATLQFFRSRPEGNTVVLEHGVLNPADPCSVPSGRDYFLGSWMPFQVGQAPASLIVQGELSAATTSIARLIASFSELEAKVDGRHTLVGDSLSLIQEDLSEHQSKLATLLDQFTAMLAPASAKPVPGPQVLDLQDSAAVRTQISLAEVARSNHEKWLAGGDRSYSKYNRPYDQLTVQERREVSLTVVNTLEAVSKATGQKLIVVDDFDDEAKAAATKNEAATKPAPGSES